MSDEKKPYGSGPQVSAPSDKPQFTKEQIEILNRRFGGTDPTKIPNPDLGFVYRGIREHPDAIKKAEHKGWEIIKDSKEAERLGMRKPDGESGVDGCIRLRPDIILAKMPKHLYKEIEERKARLRRDVQIQAREKAKEAADRIGVEYIGGETPLIERKGK